MILRRFALAPRALVVSLLSLVALTACTAAEDAPDGGATPSSSSTSSSSAEPVADAFVPTPAFGGECANLFSVEEVGTLLGAPVVDSTLPDDVDQFARSIPSVGGLACRWWQAEGTAPVALVITVLPAASLVGTPGEALMDGALAETDDCDAELNAGLCEFSLLDQGYWFHGTLFLPEETTNDEAHETVDSLLALASAAVPSEGDADAVALNTDAPGAWSVATDCAALAQTVDVAALLGNSALELTDRGTGPLDAPYGWSAARAAAAQDGCIWADLSGSGAPAPTVRVDFLPGGSWVVDEVAAIPGAQELTGTGVGRVFLITDPSALADEPSTLQIFDGANWVSVTGSDLVIDDSFLPFAVAVVAAKNDAE